MIEDYFQSTVVPDATVPTNRPVIRGTRVAVEFVDELLSEGWTPQEIARHFGNLTSDGMKPQGIISDDESATDDQPQFPRLAIDDGSGMRGGH